MGRKGKTLEKEQEGYNITITGRHVHVTDAMKDYAVDKVAKVERFSDRIIDVVVTMDIQKLDHIVDIVLKVNHIKIKAHAISENMYASIDKALTKLQTQLLKYKNKLQKHQAKGTAIVDMNVNVLQRPYSEDEIINDEIEDENRRAIENQYKPHEIVEKETRPLKTLTTDEAVMKMELSGDRFLIFKNEEDSKIKVIYRREDDNFGIIEPE